MKLIGILAFLLTGALRVEVGNAEVLSRFHLVLPTRHVGFNPDRDAGFKLEFRNVAFSEIKDALEKCQSEGLLPSFELRPPLLSVYLPDKDILESQKEEIAAEIRKQFNAVYPSVPLKIEFRVPKTALRVTYFYSSVKSMLRQLKGEVTEKHEKAFVERLERSNDEAYREALKSFNLTASVARRIKYTIASSRFFLVAATRAAQVSPALVSGDPAVTTAGLALILTDASTEFFTVAFTQKIQRLFMRFPLRSSEAGWRTKAFTLINSAVWNLALFSVGRPTIMQALGHVADPNIPEPSLDSISNVMGWSTVGAVFYAAFTKGYNTLRDKGWVSSSQIDMALQVSGMFDLATGILNSNPNWFPYRIFTWGPQWLFYSAVALAAKLAPVRADKIIAVDSTILDWRDIHEEQVTDVSWHIHDETDFQEALGVLKSSAHCDSELRGP